MKCWIRHGSSQKMDNAFEKDVLEGQMKRNLPIFFPSYIENLEPIWKVTKTMIHINHYYGTIRKSKDSLEINKKIVKNTSFVCGFIDHKDKGLQAWRALWTSK